MSNTPHKDALTAEQILEKYRNCEWNGEGDPMFCWDCVIKAMEEYVALQQPKGNDLEPGVPD
jgi:hypothetical protein